MKKGCFLKLTHDRTMKFKNEKCIGRKLFKNHITVLVPANMTLKRKKAVLHWKSTAATIH